MLVVVIVLGIVIVYVVLVVSHPERRGVYSVRGVMLTAAVVISVGGVIVAARTVLDLDSAVFAIERRSWPTNHGLWLRGTSLWVPLSPRNRDG